MTPINNAASIHQKILNKAAIEHKPFNELLQYYAIERFLYRLSESPYCDQFVLKGALVFFTWQAPLTRPTRDMDFLGYTENSINNLVLISQEICSQSVEADGIIFDPATVHGEVIKEEAAYQGVRINFLGFLGKAKINMRLDVGFADVITPAPREVNFPSILDHMSKPCIRAYPPETVIAEKYQAMIALGMVNSRMKDFYDLWFMTQSMDFDFLLVREAIFNTFDQRNTPLPQETPTAFTDDFAVQKQVLWVTFLKKNQLFDAPVKLIDAIKVLNGFFSPMIAPTEKQILRWSPDVGWR